MLRLVGSGLVLLRLLAGTCTVDAAPMVAPVADVVDSGAPGLGDLELQVVEVPEPSILLLLGTGLLIVAALAKRRSTKAK